MALNPTISSLLFALTIFTIPNVLNSATHHTAAPTPAVDCSTVVLSMADCLSYVISGSTVKKPEGSCCSGLKTVLKSNAECLCEAFKNSAQLGVSLNITKALALPSACHISAPSATNCGVSISAGATPALSPMPASTSSSTTGVVANELAPAPAPESAGSSVLSISVLSLIFTLLVASFSMF